MELIVGGLIALARTWVVAKTIRPTEMSCTRSINGCANSISPHSLRPMRARDGWLNCAGLSLSAMKDPERGIDAHAETREA